MQQLQLLRQCTAAALNLAASEEAGLGCETERPGIEEDFARCCVGEDPVCNSDSSSNDINASECIGILDSFNNAFEATDFPEFLGGVFNQTDTEQCREADSNGLLNPGRNLGD